jgi:hypothetical protein
MHKAEMRALIERKVLKTGPVRAERMADRALIAAALRDRRQGRAQQA